MNYARSKLRPPGTRSRERCLISVAAAENAPDTCAPEILLSDWHDIRKFIFFLQLIMADVEIIKTHLTSHPDFPKKVRTLVAF